jgi:hypothetical protein
MSRRPSGGHGGCVAAAAAAALLPTLGLLAQSAAAAPTPQQITWFYANDLAVGADFLAAIGLVEVPDLIQRDRCRIFHATAPMGAGFLGVCNSRPAPVCGAQTHGDTEAVTFTLVAANRSAVDAQHAQLAPLNGTRLVLTPASGSASWGAYGFNFYDLDYENGLGCMRFEVQSFDDPAWPPAGPVARFPSSSSSSAASSC